MEARRMGDAEKAVCPSIRATDYKCPKYVWMKSDIISVGKCSNSQNGEVVDANGVSPCLASGGRGHDATIPKMIDLIFRNMEKQKKDAITAIEVLRTITPDEESSGTGFTKYAVLRVSYCSGKKTEVKVSYWHETVNTVYEQLYDALAVVFEPENAYNLLSRAVDGLVKRGSYEELDYRYRRPKSKVELPPELQGKRFRIRKLTPRECGRLMDVDDADIDKIEATGLSNSAMYRLYGNSIVVNVLYHIFRKAFIETAPDIVKGEPQQLTLF